MPEESAHLPLTITPEELEKAEIAVLLDFLRENAARHDVSELREQALAVGYRDSVVDRACADFDEELRSFLETGLELVPEPPPARVEERPRPPVSPVPVPPPPKVPVFLEKLAEAEKKELAKRARFERSASPWLALLIVILNAVLLLPVFNGKADLSILAYSTEIALALLFAWLQKIHSERRRKELAGEAFASPLPLGPAVHSEAGRTPVPTLPHEVRTETPETSRIPQRAPSRD